MSDIQTKKAVDITNLILTVGMSATLAIFGYFGSKAFSKLDDTHDLVILTHEQVQGMRDRQNALEARLVEQDKKIYFLTQKQ